MPQQYCGDQQRKEKASGEGEPLKQEFAPSNTAGELHRNNDPKECKGQEENARLFHEHCDAETGAGKE